MLILAIDTTSEEGGVAVFRETECLASVENLGTANQYSVTLFEMVERALAEAHVALAEMELFAVANGPGSFTGIRIGLAAARAWGKVFDRPVRGVSVLAALVNKARVESEWVFPLLDARRGEFYLGCFRREGDAGPAPAAYAPFDAGWVLNPDAVQAFVEERLRDGGSGTGLARAHDSAALELCESLPVLRETQRVDGTLLDSIAALALAGQRGNVPRSDTELDAYYIRRPDAETNWKN